MVAHTVDFNARFPSNLHWVWRVSAGSMKSAAVLQLPSHLLAFLSTLFHDKWRSETTELFLFMLRLEGMDVQTGRAWRGQRSLRSSFWVKPCSLCSLDQCFICRQWRKHWFVLCDTWLRYYRDSEAEQVRRHVTYGEASFERISWLQT